MARQAGLIKITGTIGDITFYKLEEEYYLRKKTSLNRKRFLKDPAFASSRIRSAQFGIASKLASRFYRSLPKEKKGHGIIGKLSGIANTCLQQGYTTDETLTLLQKKWNAAIPDSHVPQANVSDLDKCSSISKCAYLK
ncbi:MAG TPA: hypothetical protein VEX63_03985 [Flavisolibacter sp.]|nr:hypothetical protein [Flavisolibacter sp.]